MIGDVQLKDKDPLINSTSVEKASFLCEDSAKVDYKTIKHEKGEYNSIINSTTIEMLTYAQLDDRKFH